MDSPSRAMPRVMLHNQNEVEKVGGMTIGIGTDWYGFSNPVEEASESCWRYRILTLIVDYKPLMRVSNQLDPPGVPRFFCSSAIFSTGALSSNSLCFFLNTSILSSMTAMLASIANSFSPR